MNISIQNGVTVSCGKSWVKINGDLLVIPENMSTNSQTIINGKIYIGGYEYFPKIRKFKPTLKALWYYLF